MTRTGYSVHVGMSSLCLSVSALAVFVSASLCFTLCVAAAVSHCATHFTFTLDRSFSDSDRTPEKLEDELLAGFVCLFLVILPSNW